MHNSSGPGMNQRSAHRYHGRLKSSCSSRRCAGYRPPGPQATADSKSAPHTSHGVEEYLVISRAVLAIYSRSRTLHPGRAAQPSAVSASRGATARRKVAEPGRDGAWKRARAAPRRSSDADSNADSQVESDIDAVLARPLPHHARQVLHLRVARRLEDGEHVA